MAIPGTRATSSWRLIRLASVALGLAAAIAGILVAPGWLAAMFPRPAIRQGASILLRALLGVYLAGLLIVAPTWLVLIVAIVRARRKGKRAGGRARALAVCSSFLIGSTVLEGLAAAWQARAHRVAPLEVRFASEIPAGGPKAGDLYIVVIGESSAMGSPFHPWASIGQIVGWQLERVFPGRRVVVDIRARGGTNLQEAIRGLEGVARRPDAVLLYSGHNEFLAYYRLSREVAYYADQISARARMTRAVRRVSSLGDLILEVLDRQLVDSPPGPSTARSLVDSPACTSEERSRIAAEFAARLEQVVAYCERIGSLPIVFIPASNIGGFDPSRSMLDPSATPGERATFDREFREARARETSDPTATIAAYRALLSKQPGFAEVHFRLAKLLEEVGAFEEANRHYIAARDRDGMPIRCTSDLLAAFRDVTARHDGVFIDASEALSPLAEHGILDGKLFPDAHHPSLAAYTTLAQEALRRLQARRAFGWPDATPVPEVTPADVVDHFGIDQARWVEVCRRAESWYKGLAPARFDPSDRLARARAYAEAGAAIAGGTPPDRAGVPAIGTASPKGGVRTSYK